MSEFFLDAEVRSDLGKGASRRVRRTAGMIPAVIYGGSKEPQSVSLVAKDMAKLIESEAVFTEGLTLNVAGTAEKVSIKALQRHPSKGFVMHADFLRA